MIATQNADGSLTRRFTLENVCNEIMVHRHKVDHLTSVLSGAAKLSIYEPGEHEDDVATWDKPGPLVAEVLLTPGSQPYLVKAMYWHRWKAEVPATEVQCHFPNGEVYSGEAH